MTRVRLAVLMIFLVASSVRAGENAQLLAAASRADSNVSWQEKSIVRGDFTCNGRKELAILGTSPNEIVVAVFGVDSAKPVGVMRFSASVWNPESAVLVTEPLDFTRDEFVREVGFLPEGLQPSKTCLGLNMSDQRVDSAHIYWDRANRRLKSWSL